MKHIVSLGHLISAAEVTRCGNLQLPVLSMTMHDGLVLQKDRFNKVIASKDLSQYKRVVKNQLVVSFPIDEGVLAVQSIVPCGIVSPAYAIWDIDETKVIPEYLEIALRSPRSIQYYRTKLKGTTARRRSISQSDFLAMEFNLPSLKEQNGILHILQMIKQLVSNQNSQLDKLNQLAKSRFIELFGERQYPKYTLIELIEPDAGLSYGIVQPGDDGTGDMGVLRPVDLVDGRISTSAIKYVNRSIGDGYQRTELNGKEILISVRGTTGITAITDSRFAGMNVTRGIAVIRFDEKKVNAIFLNAAINEPASQAFIQEHTRGATLKQINLADLRRLPILLPPLALQNEFAAFIEELDKSKVTIQKSLDRLNLLYKALLQEYFG